MPYSNPRRVKVAQERVEVMTQCEDCEWRYESGHVEAHRQAARAHARVELHLVNVQVLRTTLYEGTQA